MVLGGGGIGEGCIGGSGIRGRWYWVTRYRGEAVLRGSGVGGGGVGGSDIDCNTTVGTR